jgi:methionyl-tRNA synthetase
MHGFPFLNSPFPLILLPFVLVAIVWTLVLKGFALWYSARGGQKKWFIFILIINTGGILEIIYLIWFRRTPPSKGESAPIISSSVQS